MVEDMAVGDHWIHIERRLHDYSDHDPVGHQRQTSKLLGDTAYNTKHIPVSICDHVEVDDALDRR